MERMICRIGLFFGLLISALSVQGQIIRGTVTESESGGTPVFGANVVVKGTTQGTSTDFDGKFQLKYSGKLPVTLQVTAIGYTSSEFKVERFNQDYSFSIAPNKVLLSEVEVSETRITEKQKEAPLTVESMNAIAIQQTSSLSFYEGLGNMKGVDLTSASLGFKVINTRGFNSTSPVRSLQLIDGVDNMSPGLNFSLGNFLGAPDLDVARVDLIQGASSAFYGPNAFNGVIDMHTKSPFDFEGLSLSVRGGERSLLETSLRWAQKFKDKQGNDRFAYKFNVFYLRANDWEANNYDPSTDSEVGRSNPGGYDAVNIYGDEALAGGFDFASDVGDQVFYPGLGHFYRDGYREVDLVDYNTENIKANAALHYLTKSKVEFILQSNFGYGTTVYQGENRYSLRDVQFYQHRFEVRKKDKFFVRLYATHEDAGNSYDAVVTAFLMQNNNRPLGNEINSWNNRYFNYWSTNIIGNGTGRLYQSIPNFPNYYQTGGGVDNYNIDLANSLLQGNYDSLLVWHQLARDFANNGDGAGYFPYFAPGTYEFDTAFAGITSRPLGQGGSRFIDRSALYHTDVGYQFHLPQWLPDGEVQGFKRFLKSASRFVSSLNWNVGGSFRLYAPNSEGTIFIDTGNVRITNWQAGGYIGVEKRYEEVKINLTARADKNENFDLLFSPAASVVYSPNRNHTVRFSASWGIRNPTLADQFLNYDVGRARLVGNLTGFDSLITVDQFNEYLGDLDLTQLDYFSVDPVRPEQVRTVEVGYRGTWWDKIYIDGSAYFSWYTDFIGYVLGVDLVSDPLGFPTNQTQAYRVATNSKDLVVTYGASVQASYYLGKYYTLSGNYSWNVLDRLGSTDPLIPAFNTPEHKFNIGFEGRDIQMKLGKLRLNNWGFNVNFKWIEGFLFEGSPQFTGEIPSYYMLDAQLNYTYPKWHTTFKVGAQNLTDNRVFQVYGGPRIGRLAYISVLFDFDFKNKNKP